MLCVETSAVAPPFGHAESSTAGRVAARQALLRCGAESTGISRHRSGAPVFPAGFYGSISHTDGIAVAAVTDEPRLVGIDIETASIPSSFDRLLVRSPIERELVNDPKIGRRGIWSAKEAAFKALHHRTDLHQGIFLRIVLYRDGQFLCAEGDDSRVRVRVSVNSRYSQALAVSDVVGSRTRW